ncbi:MAG: 2-amino-4-hydroxy-6-hydroxymethyldihydropteridine diphosphokinase [Kiritimatiellae bacterium]|nr:2-amino-4-hydroxy-6-hydroxymethyldihydropteridine diphosphokinase [Kiritimatiellia bacterium]
MYAIEAGLSIGSNLGDRLAQLRAARDAIARIPEVRVTASAPLYETEPVGCPPEFQKLAYYNTVLLLGTSMEAHRLFAELQKVETALGRSRRPGHLNEPRPIDIDLIFYDGQSIRSGGLVVPHPRWSLRRFVLQPLADLRPGLVLPGHDRSVSALLAALPDGTQPVRLVMQNW